MKRITECRICNSMDIVEFLDLGEQPFANSLLKSLDEPDFFYPLSLSWCPDCHLVQLNHTAEPEDLFSNYVWVTSTSRTAREHSESFCNEILSRIKNLEKSYVLEIASNDGTFLSPFVERGYNVLGVDPARNIVDIATANGVPTKCKFFGAKAAREIIEELGQANVVIARNVLPHVANLHDFVKGLHMCMQEEGLLVIEFHYAMKIYEELHYDSIYHEHLCYFTMESLEKLLGQFNLFVTDIKESPISGGSLILYITKKAGNELPIVRLYRDSEKKIKLNELNSWQNFTERTFSHREQLLNILTETVKKTGPMVGYGASARSSTLLNFCGIDPAYIKAIIDSNPLKQGMYSAGTSIPIVTFEKGIQMDSDPIFILAWNFRDEIVRKCRVNGYKGEFLLAFPQSPYCFRS